MGAFTGGVERPTEKDRAYLIAVGLLFVELLAGVVWGIQRGLSSLFAKDILLIASFTQIGMVTSVFGLTKAITNLCMGALSDRVGRKPVIVVGAVVAGFLLIPETNGFVHEERTRPKERVKITSYAKQLAPMYFAGFSSKIMDSLVVSFLPLYLTGLGMDINRVATVMSAFTFSWALLQPVTGHASDRVGRKRIIVVGLAGSVISVVTFTLTGSFTLLVACSLLLGVEAALFYTPLVAMVSDIAPSELEGTLIGSYRFFRDLGYFAGPLLLGAIADNMGLTNAFYATSLILLVATVTIQLLAKETVERAD